MFTKLVDQDSAVAILRKREKELMNELEIGTDDHSKKIEALVSVRAALKRWEDNSEKLQAPNS